MPDGAENAILRPKKTMEKTPIKRITVDDIYRSILTKRRVTNAEGWTRMEPIDHPTRLSGSPVVDAVARLLEKDIGMRPDDITPALGISKPDLSAALRVATGMNTAGFLRAYRLTRAREWLARTDLSIKDISGRSGFLRPATFHNTFVKYVGMTPGKYRRLNRPADFRELYEWEK